MVLQHVSAVPAEVDVAICAGAEIETGNSELSKAQKRKKRPLGKVTIKS
jgi:hypothetical protein